MMKCCICGSMFDIGYEMPNGDYVCAKGDYACARMKVAEYFRCEGKTITQESEVVGGNKC